MSNLRNTLTRPRYEVRRHPTRQIAGQAVFGIFDTFQQDFCEMEQYTSLAVAEHRARTINEAYERAIA